VAERTGRPDNRMITFPTGCPGTRTKVETVNAALAFVAERRKRAEVFDDPLVWGSPDLADLEIRAQARRWPLARRSQHRAAGCPGILTAAIAEHYGATVLHYDSDFDQIAAVSNCRPGGWFRGEQFRAARRSGICE
jgi:predicted nucleic acid-binding protein